MYIHEKGFELIYTILIYDLLWFELWIESFISFVSIVLIVDCKAREIIHLVASVCLSVRLFFCLCSKENHHDTWNTVQDFCVFVSNQETFAIENCMQRLRAFNSIDALGMGKAWLFIFHSGKSLWVM